MWHYRTKSWDKWNNFDILILMYMPICGKHRHCNSHISSYECKIWIITTRQLRVSATSFFHIFHIHISLKQWKLISDNTFHKLLKCNTSWSKTRPSFSGAHNSYIYWSFNTIIVSRIGTYIRINIPKTDLIYLKIWCNSVIFCQRGHFYLLTLYNI